MPKQFYFKQSVPKFNVKNSSTSNNSALHKYRVSKPPNSFISNNLVYNIKTVLFQTIQFYLTHR